MRSSKWHHSRLAPFLAITTGTSRPTLTPTTVPLLFFVLGLTCCTRLPLSGYYFTGDGCTRDKDGIHTQRSSVVALDVPAYEDEEKQIYSFRWGAVWCSVCCCAVRAGYYWITGRVDDVINVSGHRIGSAEVESALVENQSVSEAAVVGVHHDIKGYTAVWQGLTACSLRPSLSVCVFCDCAVVDKPSLPT